MDLLEKSSTLDPKSFYAISFQKLVFLISLYPKLWRRNVINHPPMSFCGVMVWALSFDPDLFFNY